MSSSQPRDRFDHAMFTLCRALVWAALVLAAWPAASHACSVPVFRYALEQWQADPYVAIVFHRGALTDAEQSLVEQLDPQGDTGNPIANILVRTVDLDDEPSDVILDLWKRHNTDTLPLLSLQTPPKLGPPQTAWQGPLTADNVAALMNSPTRQQVRERLLSGESVVWVFLESGDQQSDDESFALLEQQLARLQEAIKLPPIEKQDLAELTVDPAELRIAFSTLRLSHHDKRERPLVEMLLRVESDLRDEPYVHQAMAFPIFGRGRALYALVGEGITEETIEDACRFLTGACQCTVKAQNPGVDLLMAVDWDQYVTPALPFDDSQPALAGLTGFASQTPTPQPPATPSDSTDVPVVENVNADIDPQSPEVKNLPAQVLPPVEMNGLNHKEHHAEGPSHSPLTADVVLSTQTLTMNITLLLGLVVTCVVLATLIIMWKSR